MYYRIFHGHPERIAEIIVEVLRFLSQLGCVDPVAVGLASVEEVREAVPEALKYFHETV